MGLPSVTKPLLVAFLPNQRESFDNKWFDDTLLICIFNKKISTEYSMGKDDELKKITYILGDSLKRISNHIHS